MPSSAVTHQPESKQQLSSSNDGDYIESHEKSASASASVSRLPITLQPSPSGPKGFSSCSFARKLTKDQAGLNLNVFGALSGAFSGKSKKQTNPDGTETEDREEHARVKGAGHGNASAVGAGAAQARDAGFKQVSGSEQKHIEA